MPRQGTESITMYTTNNQPLKDAFERVHDHLGRKHYSQSAALAQLVLDKDQAIQDGETRRAQIKFMRQDIDALRVEIAELKTMIQELTHGYQFDHA